MSEIKKMSFGTFSDEDKSLKNKDEGVFGLNSGHINVLEFNPNGGKDNKPVDCVDITVVINTGKEYRNRIFDVTRVFDKKGNVIEDTESKEYKLNYNMVMSQNMGVIVHFVKAVGVTQEQIDNALKQEVGSFGEWAKIICSLKPLDFYKKDVDVFLEYQWSIQGNNNRTYLILPKNMKGGKFLVKHITPNGFWKKEIVWKNKNGLTEKGLKYVDNAGNIHPFIRSENYMNSNKAIQQNDSDGINDVLDDLKNVDETLNDSGSSLPF